MPVPEIQYLAYLHNAEDQLRGEAATLQFFSQGQYRNGMVVRIAGYGYQKGFGGHFHNDDAVGVLRDIPGLVIASPARPDDASAMLRDVRRDRARRRQRVRRILEPIALYHTRDLYEEGDELWLAAPTADDVPLGSARTYGDGSDLTIVTWANGLRMSLRAARTLEQHGVSARVVDLRWLAPLPVEDIAARGERDRPRARRRRDAQARAASRRASSRRSSTRRSTGRSRASRASTRSSRSAMRRTSCSSRRATSSRRRWSSSGSASDPGRPRGGCGRRARARGGDPLVVGRDARRGQRGAREGGRAAARRLARLGEGVRAERAPHPAVGQRRPAAAEGEGHAGRAGDGRGRRAPARAGSVGHSVKHADGTPRRAGAGRPARAALAEPRYERAAAAALRRSGRSGRLPGRPAAKARRRSTAAWFRSRCRRRRAPRSSQRRRAHGSAWERRCA